MKTITITAASLAILASGCTGIPVGTLNNQSVFGQSYVDNQSAQMAYATKERLKNLGTAFTNAVPSMVNFEFNKSNLDSEAQRVLNLQAAWIKKHPGVRFSVFGHTDLVGSAGYNRSLGLRRAKNAVNYLVSRGVNRHQLSALVSKGESQPLIAAGGPERLNRRAVTGVTGFMQNNRGTGMDGKRALIVYNEYVTDEGSEIVAQGE